MRNPIQTGLISVIVPVYNGENFISESLESISAQTYKNVEVIVVDDGSTDNSRRIVENIEIPTRYYYQQNMGAGAARNCGADKANGEFIAFLDQDDYWFPTKLEKQISILGTKPEMEAAIGLIKNIPQRDWKCALENRESLATNSLVGMVPSVMLLRRESFYRIGQFETASKIGEVVDWIVRAKEKNLHIETLQELLVLRRIHTNNHGIVHRGFQKDYLHVLKKSIDRRRAGKEI